MLRYANMFLPWVEVNIVPLILPDALEMIGTFSVLLFFKLGKIFSGPKYRIIVVTEKYTKRLALVLSKKKTMFKSEIKWKSAERLK